MVLATSNTIWENRAINHQSSESLSYKLTIFVKLVDLDLWRSGYRPKFIRKTVNYCMLGLKMDEWSSNLALVNTRVNIFSWLPSSDIGHVETLSTTSNQLMCKIPCDYGSLVIIRLAVNWHSPGCCHLIMKCYSAVKVPWRSCNCYTSYYVYGSINLRK